MSVMMESLWDPHTKTSVPSLRLRKSNLFSTTMVQKDLV